MAVLAYDSPLREANTVNLVANQVKATYNEENIFTPERLDHVRLRPTAYFQSKGIEGLVHQGNEIIVNGMDELALMPDGVGKLTVLLCVDNQNQTYQLVVKDNGRGLPIGKLLDSYTKLNTSGKFDTNAYETSGGLYGVGAKASSGTSRDFRAITSRPEGKASIHVHEGKSNEVVEFVNAPQTQTGVTVFYEPDPIIFDEIDQFSVQGQAQLVLLLQKYCFFRRLNLEFRVHHFGLPSDIWTKKIPEAEIILDHYIHESQIVFSEPTFDRVQWLRNFYWNLQRPFAFQYEFDDKFKSTILNKDRIEQETTVRYQAQLYYVKFDLNGGRFGMLNNLPIDDPKSTHLLTVIDAFKEIMAPSIKDVAMRKYFIDTYKIPIYLAVDVKCPGAEPSGTTKDAFYSNSFKKVYAPSLRVKLSTPEGLAFISAVYAEIATDIEDSYMKVVVGVSKAKNTNRLFEDLNYPEKFTDCNSVDRRDTELFLTEGDSANGSEGRSKETQGQYALKGKSFNGIDTIHNLRDSVTKILKDEIYQDIIKIMGVNPAKFDLATMYFKRLLITTDADIHGYHISSILTGNLYAICPEMIEAGVVSVVMPPLYSLDLKSKKKGTPRVYLRDDKQKVEWMTTKVYMEALKIGVRAHNVFDKIRYLTQPEFIDFVKLVLEIGEAIDNIAAELVLPPVVIEVLSYVTAYLEPGKVDIHKIKEITKADKVAYDPIGHILILTHGRDDHIIPLENVCTRLYSTIIPLLQKIAWKKLQVYITTKHVNQFKDTPMSVVGLYKLLQVFDDLFEITRYKGLASMPALDRNRTCMDPRYRNVHQITTVGDVDVIFKLLGSNSSYRKQLLKRE